MTPLRLNVRKIDRYCLFELRWSGQEYHAELAYPETLTTLYQAWQRAYLSFYKTTTLLPSEESDVPHPTPTPGISPSTPPLNQPSPLRARVEGSGSFQAKMDWRTQLVQAEAELVAAFYRWLSSAELLDIRRVIAGAVAANLRQFHPKAGAFPSGRTHPRRLI